MIELSHIVKESVVDTCRKLIFPYIPLPQKNAEDELHLQKTIEWLQRACEHGKGGVSSHYSLVHGKWLNPFPETTGYIIQTLFDYADFAKQPKYFDLAVKLADWLGKAQLDNGACMQGGYDEKKGKNQPVIFNTGQNILGFVRTFEETQNEKYLNFAVKAGDFLAGATDQNGIWDKHLHRGLKHTINSRTAWALLELHQYAGKREYARVAESNLDWTVKQQSDNGWFMNCKNRENGLPHTHFLSYTCEGLIQSYLLTKNERYLNCAIKTALKMLRIFEVRQMLYAFWDQDWQNHGKYLKWTSGKFVCLTGVIQISGVWMQLYEITNDIRYLNSAFKMLDYVKTLHDITTKKLAVNGAIKGSFPIYGGYSSMMYPNWAAKFFADALMLKIKLKKQLQDQFAQNNSPYAAETKNENSDLVAVS